jgi:LmbE family N-acetylglucosaminyl deacetylase
MTYPHLAPTTHLCIAAHPDDIEIMAFGAIAECYAAPGLAFTGVTVTDGGGAPRVGEYAQVTDAELAKIREKEQNNAAEIGKYLAQLNLGFSSQQIKVHSNPALHKQLMQIIAAAAPQVLYTHNLADKHATHIAVALHVVRAVRELVAQEAIPAPRVIGMEVWRSLDWLCDADKIAEDSGALPHLASALIAAHKSQISPAKRYDLAAPARRLANAVFHESHEAEGAASLSFGMDMTPLCNGSETDPAQFVNAYIERFREDVITRLNSFSPNLLG